MKRTVIGTLAHVDAGKTTLSEAMLYCSGSIRRLGRVDHQDAFLDTEDIERERGITVFSKQARFSFADTEFQLLDTPGHVDFSAEMERILQVLDYALLVISGTDGVQGHTRTLWRLLARYGIPVFIFVNKMDIARQDGPALLASLKNELGDSCIPFGQDSAALNEQAALCSEDALAEYLAAGELSDGTLIKMISARQLFPVFFGSALKLDGVEALLHGLGRFVADKEYPDGFGAKVYKIARDAQGARLTYMKITGGELRVKAIPGSDGAGDKVDQIRLYSGTRYILADAAPSGTICAVTGLGSSYPGEGFGIEADSAAPALEPVLSYKVDIPDGTSPHIVLGKLRVLEEEDPMLRVVWNETLREIHLQLMGEIQLEILQHLMRERFGMQLSFGAGSIVYKETIESAVRGMEHFEPLRHYAEVHLRIEPGESGSGILTDSICPEDDLAKSWQRLIMTHLHEKKFLGVLTGSPLTDVKITLLAGRAHLKHTEGGDFRQATYRAVRQGLMQAKAILLEPWYSIRLEVPLDNLGRAMADLQMRFCRDIVQDIAGDRAVLSCIGPVQKMQHYAAELIAYTHGKGDISCSLYGYLPCHNADEVVQARQYDPERDVDNTPDSVFCSHGAGFIVKWQDVPAYAHIDTRGQ